MANSDRLCDRFAPVLLITVALAGAYRRQMPAVALAIILLCALLLTRFWSRRALCAIQYSRQFSPERAFPGDELVFTARLANHKLLPLPWVEVEEKVSWPQGAVSVVEPVDTPPSTGELRMAGSVSWHEQVAWRYRILCRKRGIFQLGPAKITSGDPFGFFPRSSRVSNEEKLIVYPRLIPIDQLDLPAGFPMGDTRAERWIFEDPSRMVGVREYRPEDSLRRIHWKATARRQQLQVKLQEPATTVEVAIFLATDTFDSAEAFEHAVSVSASMAHILSERRLPAGLYINGGFSGSRSPMEISPGRSEEQLTAILEALAGVEATSCVPTAQYLPEAVGRLPWGSSVILVAGGLADALLEALRDLRDTGHRPMVVLAEDSGQGEDQYGIPVFRVGTGC